jgi:hypothetical protein
MNLFNQKDSLTSLNLNSDDFFLPYLSKIKCSWYYQKYPINLTDTNDLVIVKIAIKQTKKDLKRIIKKINSIEIINEQFVPKRNYDFLLENFNQLAVKLIHLKNDFVETHQTFKRIETEQADLIIKRDRLIVETERLKSKLTPRPSWFSKCANHVSCGPKKWQSFVNKYSSDELVDILLNEFIGGNDETNVNHFLEFNKNTYENMKLCKRDVLLIIHEILNERFQSIIKSDLKDFIHAYFCKKYEFKDVALKWFYNLIDCLERYDYEENVSFLKSILNRKIDENIYHSFRNTLNELISLCNTDFIKNEKHSADEISHQNNLNQILSRDSSINSFFTKNEKSVSFSTTKFPISKSNTRIPEENLIKILKSKFPTINSHDLRDFINAARTDLLDKTRRHKLSSASDQHIFDLNILFQIENDGSLTEFSIKLKKFLNKIRNNYTLKFLQEIISNRNFIISENTIKCENSDYIIESSLSVDDEKSSVKIDKVKRKKRKKIKKLKVKLKKLKKKIYSKLRLLKKKKKKVKRELIVKTETPIVTRSISMDSLTSYDIDIKDQKIYSQMIHIDEFRTLVISIDPDISILEIQRYINWVFESNDDLIKVSEITVGRAIRKLQNLNCFVH